VQSVGLKLLDDEPAAVGLSNFRGATEMSWHGFADRLLGAAETMGLARPSLQAIKSAELNAPAKRPAYAVLSCARIRQTLGIGGTRIEDEIERMVRHILAA
jgi:dTDP-4-dehydrorhamnose reductase